MNIFKKTLLIYPEIQRPLLVQVIIGLSILAMIQALCIYWAMSWLSNRLNADISLIIDYRVFGIWNKFLYASVFIPMFINIIVGMYLVLFVSNKFAGPLFRLEREIDRYLNSETETLNIKFRSNDYLIELATKVNKIYSYLSKNNPK